MQVVCVCMCVWPAMSDESDQTSVSNVHNNAYQIVISVIFQHTIPNFDKQFTIQNNAHIHYFLIRKYI